MTDFNWWFAAISLVAILFVIWPLLSHSKSKDKQYASDANRVELNLNLYNEHLDDIQKDLDSGAITPQHYEKLKKEYTLQFEQDNLENAVDIEVKKSSSRWSIIAVSISLPIAALAIYWMLGFEADIEIERLNEKYQRSVQASGGESRDIATAIELKTKLEKRLQQRPENFNNQFLLARVAFELEDYRLAIASYQKILEQHPESPQVLAEMAQVLYVAVGRQFTPEVRQLFDRAIEVDPENTTVIGFAGITAFQSSEFQLAIDYWQNGMPYLAATDQRRQSWQGAIDEAKRQMIAAGLAVAEQPSSSDNVEPKIIVNISVKLAENVDAKPSETVFIYARAWQKTGMPPLAVKRLTVADLPAIVQLDETQVMAPGMPSLADFDEVGISVLVSKAGVAQARSGDWRKIEGPINPKTHSTTIELLVDSQVP